MNGQTFFIGEAAKRAHSTIKAIRYYERIELIPEAPRDGKYRLYSDKMVERIQFIKTSQSLGFSLQEIREILSAYDLGEAPCGEVEDLIDQKLPLIERKIQELQVLHQELNELKHQLAIEGKGDTSKICPVIHNREFALSSKKSKKRG